MDELGLSGRYEKIRRQISSFSSDIVLIAVSKFQSIDQIEELYRLGQRDFGENYVQELVEKANELSQRGCDKIRWHFIGHLQTNKIKMLLPYVSCVHTIDTLKLAFDLSAKLDKQGQTTRLPVFVQVNIDNEQSKSGFLSEDVLEAVKVISGLNNLSILGFMCIPSVAGDKAASYRRLDQLLTSCRSLTQGKLSMGMSNDYALAIREGATHVRIGTALFGERLKS